MPDTDPVTHSAKGTAAEALLERVAQAMRVAAQRRYGSQMRGGHVPWDQASPGVRDSFTTASKAAMLALADAIDDAAPIEDTATWLRVEADRG